MSNNCSDDEENDETSSTVGDINGSVISTVPDRHGFLGGSQYSPEPKQILPPSVVFRREQKWLHMFQNWEKMMDKKYKTIRKRCRKGIPPSVRPRAWLYLSTAKQLMEKNEGVYDHLLSKEGDPRWIDDIQKDLHRQFPYHEMFLNHDGHGQKDLFDVLKAYSIMKPRDGYCQAQAPIAAFLLMHMPAEQAFWCLVSVCDKYLSGYYSQGMETLQVDGDVLFALLKKTAPHIYKHLRKQKIEPILCMTEWFLCVFTRTLPWTTLLRVWDVFLLEGVKVIFKVGLLIIRTSLHGKSVSSLKKRYPTMYETLEALRNPPTHLLEETRVIEMITESEFSDDELKYATRRVLIKRASEKQSSK